jgi:hypothetical protein
MGVGASNRPFSWPLWSLSGVKWAFVGLPSAGFWGRGSTVVATRRQGGQPIEHPPIEREARALLRGPLQVSARSESSGPRMRERQPENRVAALHLVFLGQDKTARI